MQYKANAIVAVSVEFVLLTKQRPKLNLYYRSLGYSKGTCDHTSKMLCYMKDMKIIQTTWNNLCICYIL